MDNVKEIVKEKYGQAALRVKSGGGSSCCGVSAASEGCCDPITSNLYDAAQTGQLPEEAVLASLGCGNPTALAKLAEGETVLDLGSGAGNDVFIARSETGEAGKVIGIDFTEAMIGKARANAEKLGYHNVEFRQGDIERMPVSSNTADVIVSNCVLNLVPDKNAVFKEIYRVLKPGGHFSISDIVLIGHLPGKIKEAAEMYAGCVAGAIQKQAYLELIEINGFVNIVIQKEKSITIPDDILRNYLSENEISEFKISGAGIFSITVYAEKSIDMCCEPGCC